MNYISKELFDELKQAVINGTWFDYLYGEVISSYTKFQLAMLLRELLWTVNRVNLCEIEEYETLDEWLKEVEEWTED